MVSRQSILCKMVQGCILKTLGRCASRKSDGGVSFFKFPSSHGPRQEWCRNLLWPDGTPIPDDALLCHYHFPPGESFTGTAKQRRRLTRNAVPYDTVRKLFNKIFDLYNLFISYVQTFLYFSFRIPETRQFGALNF